ncbi:class I SAM-dependent methyltransferase [Streptantibioticus ferralitis]|uniref:Class I SAM-dependent methyltransferase n=1 Tax=Streptantibioticus ferralitis TaxID=236510 RepID=A0ABT5YT62_9ACTN|nr:class I SAM-dependent methyltransferase [Streptantibioticus ferralitis]MDF2254567.1 class I SAM-dependent methyltransferase [Streptantibioticus ferralitis]
MTETSIVPADWQAWQESWDRQQEWYLPDREERFRVMLDLVEAVAGPSPVVLDLACGTGSISDRLLKRFPEARSTALDLDPALLTIARGHFADEPRIQFVTADLRDPEWTRKLPHREFDAVLTATALHWLQTEPLAWLYGEIAGVLRDGGIFMNADHMPDPATPRINAAEHALRHARMGRERSAGAVPDWREWWQLAAADEQLAAAVARRYEIFGDHADGEPHPVEWHAQTLRDVGFSEARAVWRSVPDAVVLGLK